MDLLPTDEQQEIVASVRAVLSDQHTVGEPLSDGLWSAAAAQGWFALGLAEDLGGVGYSLVEESLLFVELGRVVAPGPFLATVTAARLAATSGDADLATSLIEGSSRAAWAEPDGEGAMLLDADLATVAVRATGGLALVDPASVPSEVVPSIDELVEVRRTAAQPHVLSTHDDPTEALRVRVLLASLMAGIAEATTAQSVEYGKDREQFGQPIGGFQAVKHRCADMAVRAEAAVMQVRMAALATEAGRADAGFHVDSASIVATSAALENTHWNVQNHGGIGFTWEHTAHRFVTRARVLAQLAGGRYAAQSSLLERSPA